MPGVQILTKGVGRPLPLSVLAGLAPGVLPEQVTLHRSDTQGGIILVGPDKTGCVLKFAQNDWYWEYWVDPSGITIDDQGIVGAEVDIVWGGRPPERR